MLARPIVCYTTRMSFEKGFKAAVAALQILGASPDAPLKDHCATPPSDMQAPLKGLKDAPRLEGGVRSEESDEYILNEKDKIPPGDSPRPKKQEPPCETPVS